jgi:hypothetical protein
MCHTALSCWKAKASGCGVELPRNRSSNQKAFASHANAALTPKARLRLARLIVEDGWKPSDAAKMFHGLDPDCPHLTPAPVRRQTLELRWRQRLGPVQIAGRLGVPGLDSPCGPGPSWGEPALAHRPGHRRTDPPIRASHPGVMIHVDVTKFANIPNGGGHRFLGRVQGSRKSTATARNRTGYTVTRHPTIGTAHWNKAVPQRCPHANIPAAISFLVKATVEKHGAHELSKARGSQPRVLRGYARRSRRTEP